MRGDTHRDAASGGGPSMGQGPGRATGGARDMAERTGMDRVTAPWPRAGRAVERAGKQANALPGTVTRLARGQARRVRHDPRTSLWQALWFPYWAGSDLPAPSLPGAVPALPRDTGPAGEQVSMVLGTLLRRIRLQWALTILGRSTWLGLLVGCAWSLVAMAGGPGPTAPRLITLSLVFVAAGVVFATLTRPAPDRVARMLDRSFGLHERTTTALANLGREVPAEGERARITYLQVADAANILTMLRHHPAFRHQAPVREIVLATACALLFAALSFMRGAGGDLPGTRAGMVPAFVPASERLAQAREEAVAAATPPAGEAPSIAEVRARARRSYEAEADLQSLGEALADHAITRPAAEDIAAGDYAGAARELRALGEQADQISPETRQALAEDLRGAAGEMSEGGQGLAGAAEAAAAGLETGGEPARAGMGDLGDAVEETGQDVIPAGELDEQMAGAQAGEPGAESAQAGSEGGDPGSPGDPADPGSAGQEPGEEGAGGDPGGDPSGEDQTGQPGAGADAAAGEGQAGEPGAGEPPSEGQGQPGEPSGGQPGAGEGAGDPQQPGQGDGEASSGGEGAPDEAGQAGAPGQGEPGQSGEGGQAGGEGESAASGAGAGTGDGESGEGQPGDAGQGEPGGGDPADQQVTGADPATGEQTTAPGDTETTVSLSGTGGQGVQTGGSSGSASLGSGSGTASGGGTATQGEVGEAGPDSNRVPPDYRDLVEDYFSDPAAP